MNERDDLSEALAEWKAIEPSLDFDARAIAAYRRGQANVWQRFWRGFWQGRVSVPVPLVALAAIVVLALAVWFRPNASPPRGIVTQIDTDGFQPMPNGAARLIRVTEVPR
jgi:hypothetical protein